VQRSRSFYFVFYPLEMASAKSADAMRGDDETRIGYETDLQNLAETLASGMSGKDAAERSWTLLALFAGGASLARTVKDETMRAKILDSVRESALKVCEKR